MKQDLLPPAHVALALLVEDVIEGPPDNTPALAEAVAKTRQTLEEMPDGDS